MEFPEADIPLALNAWRKVTNQITGADEVLQAFEKEWLTVVVTGQTSRKLDRCLFDALEPMDWSWPWFEEWLVRFREWGAFPLMWDGIDRAEDLTEIEAVCAQLISHTSGALLYRDRQLRNYAKMSPQSRERWVLVDVGDPIEMRIAAPHRRAIEAGEFSQLPPFFPGDRTTFRPAMPGRITVQGT